MIRPLQVSGEFVYGLLLFGNTPGFVLAAESLWEPAWLSVGPPHPQGLSTAPAPLQFSGYRLQSSQDLASWRDTQVVFGPALTTLCVSVRSTGGRDTRVSYAIDGLQFRLE